MKTSFRNPFYEYGEKLESIKELILFSAERYGENTAFCYKSGNQIINKTYHDLLQDVRKRVQLLKSFQLERMHIAIIGKTSYDWIVSYLSVMYAGMVAVPIDILLNADEYCELIKRADVDCIFCDPRYYLDINKHLPDFEKVVCINEINKTGYEMLTAACLEELHTVTDKNEYENAIDANALATIVFTSGTTGKSKGAMLSQRNLICDVMSAKRILGLKEQDVSLSILPLYHTYEMTCDILLMMYFGAATCLNDSLKYMSQNLKLFKPTVLFAVPMVVEEMHRTIMDSVKKSHKDKIFPCMLKLSSALNKLGIHCSRRIFKKVIDEFGSELRLMVSGGAPLNQSYIDFFDAIGINLVQGYGITECSPLLAANPDHFKKKHSVGRIVSCCEVKIKEMKKFGSVNGHMIGEVLAKGDNVMLGYYKDKETTADVMEGEWFKTGDLGWLDEDNYLYITGRVKNLIILSNGKNVSPEKIEQELLRLSSVKEVQVTAHQENHQEQIRAVIFPDETFIRENKITDIQTHIENEVNHINRKFPVYMQITSVIIRDCEFQKTSTKKIKRY